LAANHPGSLPARPEKSEVVANLKCRGQRTEDRK
jgi:hypothetical protein